MKLNLLANDSLNTLSSLRAAIILAPLTKIDCRFVNCKKFSNVVRRRPPCISDYVPVSPYLFNLLILLASWLILGLSCGSSDQHFVIIIFKSSLHSTAVTCGLYGFEPPSLTFSIIAVDYYNTNKYNSMKVIVNYMRSIENCWQWDEPKTLFNTYTCIQQSMLYISLQVTRKLGQVPEFVQDSRDGVVSYSREFKFSINCQEFSRNE